MPQISKKPLSKDTYRQIYSTFVDSITKNQTKKDFQLFLHELLTPTEKVMLSKRLLIAYLLEKGLSYREISTILHVSTSTVNKIDLNYRTSNQMKVIIKKVLKRKSLEDFLLNLGISLTSIIDLEKSKTKVWKHVKKDLQKTRSERL